MRLSKNWFYVKLLGLKMVCGASLLWKCPSESFDPSPSSGQGHSPQSRCEDAEQLYFHFLGF